MMLEPGIICMKLSGREAGKYCVVLERPKDGFVMITGPKSVTGVKRRKCNIFHLEPTSQKLALTSTEDGAVEAAWKGSGLTEKLGIVAPMKRAAAKRKGKEEKK